MKALYICYFGLREPLVQTQVLPYLRHISTEGVEMYLLTFEPHRRSLWSSAEIRKWELQLEADGIRWCSLPYHKWPRVPVTLYDIVLGALTVVRLVRREGIDTLHARSHIPMAMALLVQLFAGCRLVFDVRGLLADEYSAAGTWTADSLGFQVIKRLERWGLERADQIVVLTKRVQAWLVEEHLADGDKIVVIPCCVDLSRFKNGAPNHVSRKSDRFEVIYAGSVTGLYLLEEMGRFFLAIRARRPEAFLRILTKAPSEEVAARLRRVGLLPGSFWVGAVRLEDVPAYLRRASLGLSFRKPTAAQIAACPTKIPEYLAAGLPVVCNAGIGDMDEVLGQAGVGVLVRTLDSKAFAEAAEQVLSLTGDPDMQMRCIRVACQHFDLEQVGRAGYLRLYRRLMEGSSSGSESIPRSP